MKIHRREPLKATPTLGQSQGAIPNHSQVFYNGRVPLEPSEEQARLVCQLET